jgi:hypothetical protein
MKRFVLMLLFLLIAPALHAGVLQRGKVQLICHRTANEDVPENTLESLAYAARMGCNIVEVDVRRTLDGVLVLNHDGYLERLTDGMGDVETTTFQELQMLDYGGWMANRFSPMRIPKFTDALRVAREQGIGLALDIKEKGLTVQIFASVQREGMLERVTFGGDDGNADELEALYPAANSDRVRWLGPECTAAEVAQLHAQGMLVVANFSANAHEMNLPAMRAAVAAGVDAINVDYPRLGADAVGRPVEVKIAALVKASQQGTIEQRLTAIGELSQFTGFPTESVFLHCLLDTDIRISHAGAVALLVARPKTPASAFREALQFPSIAARQNAAWALGMMRAPVTPELMALLKDSDPAELKEVLHAISRSPGEVSAGALLPFLRSEIPTVRASAALALAAHQPQIAAARIIDLLHRDEQRSADSYAVYVRKGKPELTQAEIDPIIEDYREHMKLIHALELLPDDTALPALTVEAFRSAEDSSHVTAPLAGFGLWDKIAVDPSAAIAALNSPIGEVADRAEWILVKANPVVLPAVREALRTASAVARPRLIRILAWQGDRDALPALREMKATYSAEGSLIDWAMQKIELLQFIVEDTSSRAH